MLEFVVELVVGQMGKIFIDIKYDSPPEDIYQLTNNGYTNSDSKL